MNEQDICLSPDCSSTRPSESGGTDPNDSAPSLFVSRDWFDVLTASGLAPEIARRDARLSTGACLPLFRRGALFHALSNYYSPDFGIQDGAALSDSETRELAKWFRAQGASRIELRPMHQDAPLLQALMSVLPSEGYLCGTFHISTNWYLPCQALRWADYLAGRPSRLVNTLRRCGKRLAKEPGFRLEIVCGATGLEGALDAYAKVYARSWKEAEPQRAFVPQLCRMAAARGWLRLGLVYLGDQPAAAQVWFVKDRTASIYKLAYDSRFAKLGVGTVLTAAMAEHVLEVDRVSEIDFLTGDDAYKAEWMTHSRPLQGLIAFDSRSVRGLVGAARHFAPGWLRRQYKRITGVR